MKENIFENYEISKKIHIHIDVNLIRMNKDKIIFIPKYVN